MSRFEAVCATATIIALVGFTLILSYAHFLPLFHTHKVNNDQRERIARNYNFEISDEDWGKYTKDRSSQVQKEMYSKWKRERDEKK